MNDKKYTERFLIGWGILILCLGVVLGLTISFSYWIEFSKQTYDRGYYYFQQRNSEALNCYSLDCLMGCVETLNETCAEKFWEKWNRPFGDGWDIEVYKEMMVDGS